MWCDNCCLIFPLRTGTMFLAFILALLDLAGAIILFIWGEFFFWGYYMSYIFAGFAMAQAVLCFFIIIGFSCRSYIITRGLFLIYWVIVLLDAVRAGVMAFELEYNKDTYYQQCLTGTLQPGVTITFSSVPSSFCTSGIDNLIKYFIIGLIIEFVFSLYLYFQMWRFYVMLSIYPITKADLNYEDALYGYDA